MNAPLQAEPTPPGSDRLAAGGGASDARIGAEPRVSNFFALPAQGSG
jgi:hypothetical protein